MWLRKGEKDIPLGLIADALVRAGRARLELATPEKTDEWSSLHSGICGSSGGLQSFLSARAMGNQAGLSLRREEGKKNQKEEDAATGRRENRAHVT